MASEQLTAHEPAQDAKYLPPIIASFFEAMNSGSLERMMRQIATDAVVNDQMQEFRGYSQIRRWAEYDVVGLSMRIEVKEVRLRDTGAIVAAKVLGDFDAPGLPDPLILLFYFVISRGKIDQLIILRSGL